MKWFPWIIEVTLIIGFFVSFIMYKRMAKRKQIPTVPGACLDMCGLAAFFLPLFLLAYTSLAENKVDHTAGIILVIAVCSIYFLCVVVDIKMLIKNYKINMKAKAEREKFSKRKNR